MQTICKCMLFQGRCSIQNEQAAYFFLRVWGSCVTHGGETLQSVGCPFLHQKPAAERRRATGVQKMPVSSAFFPQNVSIVHVSLVCFTTQKNNYTVHWYDEIVLWAVPARTHSWKEHLLLVLPVPSLFKWLYLLTGDATCMTRGN